MSGTILSGKTTLSGKTVFQLVNNSMFHWKDRLFLTTRVVVPDRFHYRSQCVSVRLEKLPIHIILKAQKKQLLKFIKKSGQTPEYISTWPISPIHFINCCESLDGWLAEPLTWVIVSEVTRYTCYTVVWIRLNSQSHSVYPRTKAVLFAPSSFSSYYIVAFDYTQLYVNGNDGYRCY